MNINKDWFEDSSLENGKYLNQCLSCREIFTGHKRRTYCKECDNMNPPTLPEYIKPGAIVRVKENDYKYRIYATDCGNTHYVHGAFFVREAWRIAAVDPERIIGPWIDNPNCDKLWPLLPPWIKYLAMDKGYGWFGYKNKPLQGISSWLACPGEFIAIPKDYAPIYSGDWRDSLVERLQ